MPFPFLRRIAAVSFLGSALSIGACTGGAGGDSSGSPSNPTDPTGGPTSPDHAAPDELDLALYVEDFAGADRASEPVRSGVPVPRAVGITDLDGFRVVDEQGAVVPAQFEVTSRWGGAPDDATKPIKWVLVQFLADVEADGTAVYRLQSSSEAQAPAPGDSLIDTDDATKIVVDTGAARFTISKVAFNLFDRVELADGTVVTSNTPAGGIYLTSPEGVRFLASAGVTEVSVEEEGPLSAVIVARGKHLAGAAALLDYTVRIQLWKDRGDAHVSYTFTERDLGSIRAYVPVDEIGIDVPVTLGANARWSIGSADEPKSGALAAEVWQRQTGNLSESMSKTFDPGNADTLHYENGGAASGTGGKAPGWIAAKGDGATVAAALRWYWQLYPKKLRVAPGTLGVEIWPSEDVNMRVYAASQKTHEMVFAFHPKGTDETMAGQAAANRLAAPLVARCNPSWYSKTRVWNRMGIAEQSAYPEELQPVVDAYFANFFENEFPTTFVDRRFDADGKGHEYSMWDYGDGRESSGFGNLAYDTPRALFQHWAITGNRDVLEAAFAAATHLRDVDIEHSPKDTRAGIRPNRGVAKPWLGRTRYNPQLGAQTHDLGFEGSTGYGFEHGKGQSLADHWFLTGDRMSKDVLEEAAHYFDQLKVDAESGYLRSEGSTRTLSHMLLIQLGYYDAYGTEEGLQRIEYLVSYLNDWQRQTSPRDPNGWMWTGEDTDTTASFQNAVTAEALILYETMFPEGIPVRENIVDAARWSIDLENEMLEDGGQGYFFNAWIGDNYGITHATVLDPMMGPMLGYAYGVTGDPIFAEVGTEVLLNAIDYDGSSPYVKAFTQQTRLVPPFLFWLQTQDAQREAGRQGAAPTDP